MSSTDKIPQIRKGVAEASTTTTRSVGSIPSDPRGTIRARSGLHRPAGQQKSINNTHACFPRHAISFKQSERKMAANAFSRHGSKVLKSSIRSLQMEFNSDVSPQV